MGVLLTIPLAHWMNTLEVGVRGSAIMILTWNILFVMLLPMVMDYSERKYFKARFVQLEEIAASNPELAKIINERCKTLHIGSCRFAVIDSPQTEIFSYGVWGRNPRLVVPNSLLADAQEPQVIPSIERELTRFSRREPTIIFLGFAVLQFGLLHLLAMVVH
jgi:Zn-dependent protease with chaperone function